MAARHGTRRGYNHGCRCDDCKDAQRLYQRRYRERRGNGLTRPPSPVAVAVVQLPASGVPFGTPEAEVQAATYPNGQLGPGPVEAAVKAELGGLAEAQSRPSLVQIALAMARILDSPRVASAQPAAAKVLVNVLDVLQKGSAPGRRGNLAAVRR
jgi:hypothetical protein